MSPEGQLILQQLHIVAAERARRHADVALHTRVLSVQQFQHARFSATYRDLLAQPRYAAATQFFLDDLYGPSDFSRRDAQFARIVPALVRLFPDEIVHTVRLLAQLHALSETLDTAMASCLADGVFSPSAYVSAWQAVGKQPQREQQIVLMVSVGSALDGYTRNPLLRHSLRLMRVPAQAAGLGALQAFLEKGFDSFRSMRGAAEFLNTIAQREKALATRLFDEGAPECVASALDSAPWQEKPS